MSMMFFLSWLQVVILAMSGSVKDAISILSVAVLSRSPSFVKKPEFSQEVVSQTSENEFAQ